MPTGIPIDRKDTLRSLRVKLGLTQKQAAKLLGVGESTLRSWEKDSSNISYSNIKKIEEVYGVDSQYIFFGKESTFSELVRNNTKTKSTA